MAREIGLRIKLNGLNTVVKDIGTLESELKKAKEDLKELEIGSDLFRELSQEISVVETRLGDLGKATEKVDTEKFASGFSQLIGGITSGFAAATAAINLFSDDTDAAAEAAADAQNLLTIALSIRGVAEVRTGAAIVAKTIADRAATLATNATTTATRTLYITLAANPYGVIIAAVGLLVTAYFALKSASDEAEQSQKEFYENLESDAGKGIAQLELLTTAVNNSSLSLEQRKEALDELKKQFPAYFKNLQDEKILTGELTIEVDKLRDSIIRQSRAKALSTRLDVLGQEELKNARQLNKITDERDKLLEKSGVSLSSYLQALTGGNIAAILNLGKTKGELSALNSLIEKTQQKQVDNENERKKIIEEIINIRANEQTISAPDTDPVQAKKTLNLLKNEYIKRLVLLRETLDKEKEENKKDKDFLLLLEKKYQQDRQSLIEDFNKDYVTFTNSLYTQLNTLTGEFYKVQENEITKSGDERMKALSQLQEAELFLLKKGSVEYNETLKKQSKEREDLQRIIDLQLKNLRIQTQLDGDKVLLDVQEKSGEENLKLQKQIYDKDFEAFRQLQIAKIRLSGQSQGLTDEEISNQISQYNKLADGIKSSGLLQIDINNEITKAIESNTNTQLDLESKFLIDKLGLQKKYFTDEEKLRIQTLKLEEKFNKDRIKNEITFLNEKLAILSKDPTMNPEELKAIKNEILKLEVEFGEKTKDTSKQQLEDVLTDLEKGLQLFTQTIGSISSLIAQSFNLQLQVLEKDYKDVLSSIVGDTKESDQKRLELEKQFQAQRAEIEKRAAIKSLEFQLVQGIANGAQAILEALPNPVLAAIAAGIAVVQVGLIRQQIQVARGLAGGGFVAQGASHERGGVMLNGGTVIEGGEVVLNRNTSMNYLPLLSSLNQQGGGQPLITNASNSLMEERLLQAIVKTRQEPIRAYVLGSEITSSQAINKRLEELSTL